MLIDMKFSVQPDELHLVQQLTSYLQQKREERWQSERGVPVGVAYAEPTENPPAPAEEIGDVSAQSGYAIANGKPVEDSDVSEPLAEDPAVIGAIVGEEEVVAVMRELAGVKRLPAVHELLRAFNVQRAKDLPVAERAAFVAAARAKIAEPEPVQA